ncbi:hypothetical protein DFH09DRAFT_1077502 [Mycena vulgaris]|nr:hypothetical protein DFH09DRAFT_1077502 [Mycena vulgaris]
MPAQTRTPPARRSVSTWGHERSANSGWASRPVLRPRYRRPSGQPSDFLFPFPSFSTHTPIKVKLLSSFQFSFLVQVHFCFGIQRASPHVTVIQIYSGDGCPCFAFGTAPPPALDVTPIRLDAAPSYTRRPRLTCPRNVGLAPQHQLPPLPQHSHSSLHPACRAHSHARPPSPPCYPVSAYGSDTNARLRTRGNEARGRRGARAQGEYAESAGQLQLLAATPCTLRRGARPWCVRCESRAGRAELRPRPGALRSGGTSRASASSAREVGARAAMYGVRARVGEFSCSRRGATVGVTARGRASAAARGRERESGICGTRGCGSASAGAASGSRGRRTARPRDAEVGGGCGDAES